MSTVSKQRIVPRVPTVLISEGVSPVLWVTFLGYAAFTVLSLFGTPVSQFDGALPLVHGLLVQQGKTPNLDFYSFYPPLNAYANAAVFALLGKSVLAARLIPAIIYVALLFLALRAFAKRGRQSRAVFIPACGLLLTTSIGAAVALPVFSGFGLSLIALLVYINASLCADSEHLWMFAASGILTAIAVLYRINFGAYALAAVGLGMLADIIQPPSGRFQQKVKTAIVFLLPFALALAGICFSIYGARAPQAISEFVATAQKLMVLRGFITLHLTVDIAFAIALPVAWFAFRGQSSASGALGIAILLLLLTGIALAGGNSPSAVPVVVLAELITVIGLHTFYRPLPRSELLSVVFYCCLLHYFFSRADWFHWRVLPIGAALMLCFAAIEAGEIVYSRHAALFLVLVCSFLLFSAQSLRPHFSDAKSGAHLLLRLAVHPHLQDTEEVLDQSIPASGWSTVYPDQDEIAALRYLRTNTNAQTPIFVGVKDHSHIFWNDLLIYWLAGRPIGVRTFQLETHVATEAPVQKQIISDLENNHVSWIVLDDSPQHGDLTFMQEGYRGSSLLDQYIAMRFIQIQRFGPYEILRRR